MMSGQKMLGVPEAQPRPTTQIGLVSGAIPLEYPCHACNGSKKNPDPTGSGSECPHCEGKGVELSPSGRVLLDFLKRHQKS